MPIDYRIDHDHRLVVARGRGVFADRDVFAYQSIVWSRPDVAGYDEMIDMTAVERIDLPSPDRIMQLAQLSASMDVKVPASKLAIVAPDDRAFGLARMYGMHRNMEDRGTKHVGVFRTRAEAFVFLELDPVAGSENLAGLFLELAEEADS